jgi:hypothetical protein
LPGAPLSNARSRYPGAVRAGCLFGALHLRVIRLYFCLSLRALRELRGAPCRLRAKVLLAEKTVRVTTKDTKSTKDEFAGRAGFECLRITPARSGPDACTDHCIHASSGFTFAFPFVSFVVHGHGLE